MTNRIRTAVILLIIMLIMLVALLIIRMQNESVLMQKEYTGHSSQEHKTTIPTTEKSLDEAVAEYVSGLESTEATSEAIATNVKIGMLNVVDTTIKYPLMYSEDLMYYTEHNSNNESDINGAIFMDARITDLENNVLLIHGLTNSSGTMFSKLSNFTDKAYAKKHNTLQVTLDEEEREYKLFAVLQTKDDSSVVYLDCDNEAIYSNFVSSLKEQSVIETDVDCEYEKQIVILNTVNSEGVHTLVCFVEE